ncbi:MAG: glycine cleavage system protein R [Propioniciclava sp.]
MVLTVIGADRPGLVQRLADVVLSHGGSWERSQLAQLAGLFAGIVVVEVPDGRAAELRGALGALDGVLHVAVHPGVGRPSTATTARAVTLDLLGNDRPGIVRELSAVFAGHGLSITDLTTDSREAPMAGGRLFEAHVSAETGPDVDLDALREELEGVAAELMIDLTLHPPQF